MNTASPENSINVWRNSAACFRGGAVCHGRYRVSPLKTEELSLWLVCRELFEKPAGAIYPGEKIWVEALCMADQCSAEPWRFLTLRRLLVKSLHITPEEAESLIGTGLFDLIPLLAAANGWQLPPEDANPELYDHPARNPAEVEPDPEALLCAVCAATGLPWHSLLSLPCRVFIKLCRAVDRGKTHGALLNAAACGLRPDKDAPLPGWQLEPRRDLPPGFQTLQQLEGGAPGLKKEG